MEISNRIGAEETELLYSDLAYTNKDGANNNNNRCSNTQINDAHATRLLIGKRLRNNSKVVEMFTGHVA